MHIILSLTATFLCLGIMIMIMIHVPTCLCNDDEGFVSCRQVFECGAISTNISYPFWGGYRQRYCGLPGFELTCEDEAPLLTMESRRYKLLSYDNRTKTITVSREEFSNNTCPENPQNATLNTNLLNYTSNSQNLTLEYGCPQPPNQNQLPTQFECTTAGDGVGTVNFFSTATVSNTMPMGTCRESVVIRVSGAAIAGLTGDPATTNVGEALARGFELQWADSNCDQCVGSGGQCGFNSSSNSFICYCSNRPYNLTPALSGR